MEFINSIIGSGFLSIEAGIFYTAGLFGMMAHYAKKRIKGQTKVGFRDYFGKNNPLSSMGAFATYAASMTGMTLGVDLATLGTFVLLVLGATSGWTIDSGINTVKE